MQCHTHTRRHDHDRDAGQGDHVQAATTLQHQHASYSFLIYYMQDVLKGRSPTLDDLDLLPFCASVVLETLRMHPPAYMIGRCAAVDVSLQGSCYEVPSKTTALIAPYLLHFNPSRWENPEEFNPSRWHTSKWTTALSGFGPNKSYLPFGGGPRVCIGTHFAFFEVILVMVTMLQNFKLVPASTFPAPEPIITLRPKAVQVRLLRLSRTL